jgi:hypothetical protein
VAKDEEKRVSESVGREDNTKELRAKKRRDIGSERNLQTPQD